MKGKLAAVLVAIATLVIGGSPAAVASPATKSVTYSISVKSGSGLDSFIDYRSSYGMTWVMKNAPWSATVKMSTSSQPTLIARSRTRDGKWPTYVCSIRVNGVLKVQKEGSGGFVQCYLNS